MDLGTVSGYELETLILDPKLPLQVCRTWLKLLGDGEENWYRFPMPTEIHSPRKAPLLKGLRWFW